MSSISDFTKLSRVMMILRFVVALAVLGVFFTAEANGQLFRRFARESSQPSTQQANGYQGPLTAKPRSRSDLSNRYDASGRRNWFRNGSARQNWQTLAPSATSQASNKPLGPQVDMAAQFRTAAKELPKQRPQSGLLGRLSPARAMGGLAQIKPKTEAETLASKNNTKAMAKPQTKQANSIPASDKITNPARTGLSLWSPVTQSSQVVPASAIAPVDASPASLPEKTFSVLQKIDE